MAMHGPWSLDGQCNDGDRNKTKETTNVTNGKGKTMMANKTRSTFHSPFATRLVSLSKFEQGRWPFSFDGGEQMNQQIICFAHCSHFHSRLSLCHQS